MKIKLFYRQFMSYSMIGIISLLIDIIVYILLSDFFLISKSLSKIISFILASINSFLGNKIFTFKLKSYNFREPMKFILLYSVSLIANSSTHDFFLNVFDGFLPFIIASIVSIIINFGGQKIWVFKNKNI
ncbi:GtrA family protein [Flavobacteriaceae bacterium]|nr:GtrA family protein [Flavobacteriaceae bacterium]